MSLHHALLGLLAEGPASGYDLTARFQEVLGHVWPAKHPAIYGELARLVEAGLIEVESEGPRRRKAYRITPEGLTEVRTWLTAGEVDHTLRLEPVLRSCFFWLMEPEDLRDYLERETEYFRSLVAKYTEYAEAKDRGDFGAGARVQSLRVTVEAGIRLYQALADWADWAQQVPLAQSD
ncbi:PadR family transcriptional regulator [Frankia sp. ACN1ag]|uniref:PadR family transcriptional regulator n=1 Tax=Frankia sp. ACN1ag TaxID=102891 RepID=UPI0006DC033D|nr:PadR family transcriptional regulator [Frankia sp. ACN1ag]